MVGSSRSVVSMVVGAVSSGRRQVQWWFGEWVSVEIVWLWSEVVSVVVVVVVTSKSFGFGEDKVCLVIGVLCALFEIRISRALVELFRNMIHISDPAQTETGQASSARLQVGPVLYRATQFVSARHFDLLVSVTTQYGSLYFGWSSLVQAFSIHFAVNSCQFSLYFIQFWLGLSCFQLIQVVSVRYTLSWLFGFGLGCFLWFLAGCYSYLALFFVHVSTLWPLNQINHFSFYGQCSYDICETKWEKLSLFVVLLNSERRVILDKAIWPIVCHSTLNDLSFFSHTRTTVRSCQNRTSATETSFLRKQPETYPKLAEEPKKRWNTLKE